MISVSQVLLPVINIGIWVLIGYLLWRVGRILYKTLKKATRTREERDADMNNQPPSQPPQDPPSTPNTPPVESKQPKVGLDLPDIISLLPA